MENLMDIHEVSELLDLKVSTIYKMICQKTIPYVKIGSAVRFSPERLQEWIVERSIEPINSRR